MANMDLDELDSFLEQAVTRHKATDAIVKAKLVKLGAKRGSDEWKTANDYVQAWERKHEWHPVQYQVRLVVEQCTCGSCATSFEGFFSVMHHRVKPTVEHKRIAPADMAKVDMATVNRYTEERNVEICANCWSTKGVNHAEET